MQCAEILDVKGDAKSETDAAFGSQIGSDGSLMTPSPISSPFEGQRGEDLQPNTKKRIRRC
jgi:hypothetical protein